MPHGPKFYETLDKAQEGQKDRLVSHVEEAFQDANVETETFRLSDGAPALHAAIVGQGEKSKPTKKVFRVAARELATSGWDVAWDGEVLTVKYPPIVVNTK